MGPTSKLLIFCHRCVGNGWLSTNRLRVTVISGMFGGCHFIWCLGPVNARPPAHTRFPFLKLALISVIPGTITNASDRSTRHLHSSAGISVWVAVCEFVMGCRYSDAYERRVGYISRTPVQWSLMP